MKLRISIVILTILTSSIAFADENSTIKSLIKFRSAVENSVSYSKSTELYADAKAEYEMSKKSSIDLFKAFCDFDVSMAAYGHYMRFCNGPMSGSEKCEYFLKMHLDNFTSGSEHLNNAIKSKRKK